MDDSCLSRVLSRSARAPEGVGYAPGGVPAMTGRPVQLVPSRHGLRPRAGAGVAESQEAAPRIGQLTAGEVGGRRVRVAVT